MDLRPPFPADLTPEDEIARFERLKPRLEEVWQALVDRDEEPYTSVVVPSLTLDQSELRKLAERSGAEAQRAGALASRSVSVAERSGALLGELVPAIRHTAELVKDVAAASRAQKAGVAHIDEAMVRVDRVTQRNAAAAEELASTAEEMAGQADAQQTLVAYFRVGGVTA